MLYSCYLGLIFFLKICGLGFYMYGNWFTFTNLDKDGTSESRYIPVIFAPIICTRYLLFMLT